MYKKTKNHMLTTFVIFMVGLLFIKSAHSASGELYGQYVTSIGSYTFYDGMEYDYMFELSTPCPTGGVWYIPAGSNKVFSLLLSAYTLQKTISVFYNDNYSPNYASSTNNCMVRLVHIK